jgi:hypothetical protein
VNEQDFPALYRSSDKLSMDSQQHFFSVLKVHLVLLVAGAALSLVSAPKWYVAVSQAAALLGALACSIYLFARRPDRYWYAARAVAESVKTMTWRFATKAEPFLHGDEASARQAFNGKLKAIVDQNRDVAGQLTSHLAGLQITDRMATMRALSLDQRKALYANLRVTEQLHWYASKAAVNRRLARLFFLCLIVVNAFAVGFALLRIKFPAAPYWPTDIFVAAAASLLTWMQAKRFTELAASYALASHEISFIADQALTPPTDPEFSTFVGDAENAFSREHTQWVARKDA